MTKRITASEFAALQAIADDRQRSYRAEYDARLKHAGEIGALKERATRAENAERYAQTELLVAQRRLAYAEGYIAALKGEAYPDERVEITGVPHVDLDHLRHHLKGRGI